MAMHDKQYRTYQVSLEEPLNKQNGKEGRDDLRTATFLKCPVFNTDFMTLAARNESKATHTCLQKPRNKGRVQGNISSVKRKRKKNPPT